MRVKWSRNLDGGLARQRPDDDRRETEANHRDATNEKRAALPSFSISSASSGGFLNIFRLKKHGQSKQKSISARDLTDTQQQTFPIDGSSEIGDDEGSVCSVSTCGAQQVESCISDAKISPQCQLDDNVTTDSKESKRRQRPHSLVICGPVSNSSETQSAGDIPRADVKFANVVSTSACQPRATRDDCDLPQPLHPPLEPATRDVQRLVGSSEGDILVRVKRPVEGRPDIYRYTWERKSKGSAAATKEILASDKGSAVGDGQRQTSFYNGGALCVLTEDGDTRSAGYNGSLTSEPRAVESSNSAREKKKMEVSDRKASLNSEKMNRRNSNTSVASQLSVNSEKQSAMKKIKNSNLWNSEKTVDQLSSQGTYKAIYSKSTSGSGAEIKGYDQHSNKLSRGSENKHTGSFNMPSFRSLFKMFPEYSAPKIVEQDPKFNGQHISKQEGNCKGNSSAKLKSAVPLENAVAGVERDATEVNGLAKEEMKIDSLAKTGESMEKVNCQDPDAKEAKNHVKGSARDTSQKCYALLTTDTKMELTKNSRELWRKNEVELPYSSESVPTNKSPDSNHSYLLIGRAISKSDEQSTVPTTSVAEEGHSQSGTSVADTSSRNGEKSSRESECGKIHYRDGMHEPPDGEQPKKEDLSVTERERETAEEEQVQRPADCTLQSADAVNGDRETDDKSTRELEEEEAGEEKKSEGSTGHRKGGLICEEIADLQTAKRLEINEVLRIADNAHEKYVPFSSPGDAKEELPDGNERPIVESFDEKKETPPTECGIGKQDGSDVSTLGEMTKFNLNDHLLSTNAQECDIQKNQKGINCGDDSQSLKLPSDAGENCDTRKTEVIDEDGNEDHQSLKEIIKNNNNEMGRDYSLGQSGDVTKINKFSQTIEECAKIISEVGKGSRNVTEKFFQNCIHEKNAEVTQCYANGMRQQISRISSDSNRKEKVSYEKSELVENDSQKVTQAHSTRLPTRPVKCLENEKSETEFSKKGEISVAFSKVQTKIPRKVPNPDSLRDSSESKKKLGSEIGKQSLSSVSEMEKQSGNEKSKLPPKRSLVKDAKIRESESCAPGSAKKSSVNCYTGRTTKDSNSKKEIMLERTEKRSDCQVDIFPKDCKKETLGLNIINESNLNVTFSKRQAISKAEPIKVESQKKAIKNELKGSSATIAEDGEILCNLSDTAHAHQGGEQRGNFKVEEDDGERDSAQMGTGKIYVRERKSKKESHLEAEEKIARLGEDEDQAPKIVTNIAPQVNMGNKLIGGNEAVFNGEKTESRAKESASVRFTECVVTERCNSVTAKDGDGGSAAEGDAAPGIGKATSERDSKDIAGSASLRKDNENSHEKGSCCGEARVEERSENSGLIDAEKIKEENNNVDISLLDLRCCERSSQSISDVQFGVARCVLPDYQTRRLVHKEAKIESLTLQKDTIESVDTFDNEDSLSVERDEKSDDNEGEKNGIKSVEVARKALSVEALTNTMEVKNEVTERRISDKVNVEVTAERVQNRWDQNDDERVTKFDKVQESCVKSTCAETQYSKTSHEDLQSTPEKCQECDQTNSHFVDPDHRNDNSVDEDNLQLSAKVRTVIPSVQSDASDADQCLRIGTMLWNEAITCESGSPRNEVASFHSEESGKDDENYSLRNVALEKNIVDRREVNYFLVHYETESVGAVETDISKPRYVSFEEGKVIDGSETEHQKHNADSGSKATSCTRTETKGGTEELCAADSRVLYLKSKGKTETSSESLHHEQEVVEKRATETKCMQHESKITECQDHSEKNDAECQDNSEKNDAQCRDHTEKNNALCRDHTEKNNALCRDHSEKNNTECSDHSEKNNTECSGHSEKNNAECVDYSEKNNAECVDHSEKNNAVCQDHIEKNNAEFYIQHYSFQCDFQCEKNDVCQDHSEKIDAVCQDHSEKINAERQLPLQLEKNHMEISETSLAHSHSQNVSVNSVSSECQLNNVKKREVSMHCNGEINVNRRKVENHPVDKIINLKVEYEKVISNCDSVECETPNENVGVNYGNNHNCGKIDSEILEPKCIPNKKGLVENIENELLGARYVSRENDKEEIVECRINRSLPDGNTLADVCTNSVESRHSVQREKSIDVNEVVSSQPHAETLADILDVNNVVSTSQPSPCEKSNAATFESHLLDGKEKGQNMIIVTESVKNAALFPTSASNGHLVDAELRAEKMNERVDNTGDAIIEPGQHDNVEIVSPKSDPQIGPCQFEACINLDQNDAIPNGIVHYTLPNHNEKNDADVYIELNLKEDFKIKGSRIDHIQQSPLSVVDLPTSPGFIQGDVLSFKQCSYKDSPLEYTKNERDEAPDGEVQQIKIIAATDSIPNDTQENIPVTREVTHNEKNVRSEELLENRISSLIYANEPLQTSMEESSGIEIVTNALSTRLLSHEKVNVGCLKSSLGTKLNEDAELSISNHPDEILESYSVVKLNTGVDVKLNDAESKEEKFHSSFDCSNELENRDLSNADHIKEQFSSISDTNCSKETDLKISSSINNQNHLSVVEGFPNCTDNRQNNCNVPHSEEIYNKMEECEIRNCLSDCKNISRCHNTSLGVEKLHHSDCFCMSNNVDRREQTADKESNAAESVTVGKKLKNSRHETCARNKCSEIVIIRKEIIGSMGHIKCDCKTVCNCTYCNGANSLTDKCTGCFEEDKILSAKESELRESNRSLNHNENTTNSFATLNIPQTESIPSLKYLSERSLSTTKDVSVPPLKNDKTEYRCDISVACNGNSLCDLDQGIPIRLPIPVSANDSEPVQSNHAKTPSVQEKATTTLCPGPEGTGEGRPGVVGDDLPLCVSPRAVEHLPRDNKIPVSGVGSRSVARHHVTRKSLIPKKQSNARPVHQPPPKPVRPPMWLSRAELSQEIQHLGTLCEARTKELNLFKLKLKHASLGFDAFASLVKYLSEDLDAFSHPQLVAELKITREKLQVAQVELQHYEKELEELKKHHSKELTELSEKLFQVYQCEVQELTRKQNEELSYFKDQHQQQVDSLTASFKASAKKVQYQHERVVEDLKQELLKQREESKMFYESELQDTEERFKASQSTLKLQLQQMQQQYSEIKQHAKLMEDALQRDTDSKLQWLSSKKADLEKEVDSLKAVLEMKNNELHSLRKENLEMQKQLEDLPVCKEKIKMLHARAEDLQALVAEKVRIERQLSTEHQVMKETYEKESKVNKRLSMENEELQWRLKQSAETSLLLNSLAGSPDVLEKLVQDLSPLKSPRPLSASRPMFFTYIDPDDADSQSPQSPRTQYKRITQPLSSPYKSTSPNKTYKSPSTPSPRKSKGSNETSPRGTPRKVAKQLAQKNRISHQRHRRIESDDGRFLNESNLVHTDSSGHAFPESMVSSTSSESSVFDQRFLEEHEDQILASLEILREQRNAEYGMDVSSRFRESQTKWYVPVEQIGEKNATAINQGDALISDQDVIPILGEIPDPKKYYHMAFPVLKESGQDCDTDDVSYRFERNVGSTMKLSSGVSGEKSLPYHITLNTKKSATEASTAKHEEENEWTMQNATKTNREQYCYTVESKTESKCQTLKSFSSLKENGSCLDDPESKNLDGSHLKEQEEKDHNRWRTTCDKPET